jgi:LysM repeat protein
MSEKTSIFNSNYTSKDKKYGACSATSKKQPKKFLIHKIQPSDSILSIAVRYDTSIEEIKRINCLWTNDIFHLSELRVPIKVDTSSSGEGSDIPLPSYNEACNGDDDDENTSSSKDPTTLSVKEYLSQLDGKLALAKQRMEEIDANGSWRDERIFPNRVNFPTSSSSPALHVKVIGSSGVTGNNVSQKSTVKTDKATLTANAVTERLHDHFYEL